MLHGLGISTWLQLGTSDQAEGVGSGGWICWVEVTVSWRFGTEAWYDLCERKLSDSG